jgi:hypothetical protein
MQNKNLFLGFAFALLAAAVALTAFAPEAVYGHLFLHLFVISIVVLALFMNIKDIIIIIMVSCSIIWAMGLFEVIKDVNHLLIETVIIISVATVLGWNEIKFKSLKQQQAHIVAYKKGQVEELRKMIITVEHENNEIMEKIKTYRKNFTGQ